MRTLLDSLNDHSLIMLRGIAELRGITLTTDVRSDAAAQLAAVLAEPSATARALATCSIAAQAAWATLRAAGGRMKVLAFTRQHGQIRPVGPGKLERERTWQHSESAAEELWYRGLIFRAFADLGEGPAEYIYIPKDLLHDLDDSNLAGPIRAELTTVPPPPRIQHALNSLAVDVCALLATLRETPARVGKTGRLRQADAERLHKNLLWPDPVRTELLVTLARTCGWLVAERGRLMVQPQTSTAWLRSTPWEQMTMLFTSWRDSTDLGSGPTTGETGWNDLHHIPALQAEGAWRNDPLLARRAILDILGRLEPNTWYAIPDLVAWIKAVNPDFQRPDGNYSVWYLRDVATGNYLTGFESWDQVEGRLIHFLITGPLFWLGAIALGEGQAGHPDVFRLTPSGAAWLSDRTPPELPRPARMSVSEDFTISAPLLLPLLDRFRLLRFTEPVSDPYVFGQPTRHRITRHSLARARAAGIKAEAILDFLRRATGGHLPQRVVAGLTRWDQHGGMVRVTRGAVLRVEDASTLSTLRADPVIAPLLGDLLSAQAVLVSNANLPKLLAALKELGYSAQVE